MSEVGAVKIVNGGKFMKLSKLKSQLTELGISCQKIETFSNGEVAVVYNSAQEAQRAADLIPSLKNFRGEQLECRYMDDYRPREPKQKKEKVSAASPMGDTARTLEETICPLYASDNELLTKQRLARNALQH